MKKTISGILFIIATISSIQISAQGLFGRNDNIIVNVNSQSLLNPWAGGLNFVQASQIDLDGDGLQDLVMFDRSGNRLTAFKNTGLTGAGKFKHAPQFQSRFPKGLHDWVLLADYNCDGKADIFGYSNGGMQIYRNDYTAATGLKFTKVTDLLYSLYFGTPTNLYVSPVNLPAFTDVDGDGDMDILTFDILGYRVEFHENKSKDVYGHCDSLKFELSTGCWGNFSLSSMNNSAVLNQSCRMGNFIEPDPKSAGLHGGSSILALDLDNDGDKDLIMGDILGDNLLSLTNGGSSAGANIISQDTQYPSTNVPVNVTTYPAPFYVDVDFDGVKDLLACPTYLSNHVGLQYYKNAGTNTFPNFQFQKSGFMQDDMIDVGEGANPALFDVDADGKLDLLIGNYGYFNSSGIYPSGISYYRNTGTNVVPAFTKVTDDWNNLIAEGYTGIYPAFGDIDKDGDMDMLIGNTDGTLHLYTNTAGAGNVPVFVLSAPNLGGIDVGQFSAPQIIDVNKDGYPDMLVGKRSGELSYYQNTGSVSNPPSFTLESTVFGGVSVRNPGWVTGYTSPYLYQQNNVYRLLVGAENGYIYQYDNIDGNLNGNFTLTDSMYQNINEGSRISIAPGDLNNDGKTDLVLGNYAGGVAVYIQDFSINVNTVKPESDIVIYPNPGTGKFRIKNIPNSINGSEWMLFDVSGRMIESGMIPVTSTWEIDLNKTDSGIYFLHIEQDNFKSTHKLFIRN